MTNIDLKRAIDYANKIEYREAEAASIIRSLCEIVEERDRLREAGQVTAMACLELANTEGLSIRQRQIIQEISDQTRSALAAAGKGKSGDAATIPPG